MITMTYGARVLTLRNPTYGNIRNHTTKMGIASNRNGELLIAHDATWPVNDTQTFDFEAISETLTDEYRAFVADCQGNEIDIIDHNGDSWTGIIITSTHGIMTNKDQRNYSFSFDFIGAKQAT